MRIAIGVWHPAHVHFFKNIIVNLKKQKHEVSVISRNKEVSNALLTDFSIDYTNIAPEHSGNLLKKFSYFLKLIIGIMRHLKEKDADIFLSTFTPYCSFPASLTSTKCIAFTDAEHAAFYSRISLPFLDKVYTPQSFRLNLGKKHIKYKGYKELTYLSPDYFKPNNRVLEKLNLGINNPFFLIRVVKRTALENLNNTGLSIRNLENLVSKMERFGQVLISFEGEPYPGFEKYQIDIPPSEIHDLMYYSSIFVGDSLTMTTEAAFLGTPSILISTEIVFLGKYDEIFKKYGLGYAFQDYSSSINKLDSLLLNHRKDVWSSRLKKFYSEMIDVNQFIIDVINRKNT